MIELMTPFLTLAIVVTTLDFIFRKSTKGFLVYSLKTAIYAVLASIIYCTAHKNAASITSTDDVVLALTFAVSVFEALHNSSELLGVFVKRE